jgi:ubiquinone/menaquinone biosynthesis C-methylase UbiE
MTDEHVPADYSEMDTRVAKQFDKKVKENFMPTVISTVKQIIEDYGVLEGVCVDVGSGTAVLAIELYRHSKLKIYALEKEKAISDVACINIENEQLTDRIIPVLGDAHQLPFENEFADFIISRGSYHCWENKVRVFKEIYRVLKKGGIAFVGGGFGRYITDEELKRVKPLRDRSLGEGVKAYGSPDKLEDIIHKANISNTRIISSETDLWAEIKK